MTEWPLVPLTEARQVGELMGEDPDALPPPSVSVQASFRALCEAGSLAAAVSYLAHALSRFEAVAWTARLLDDESRRRELPFRDRLALDHALRWLGEPNDAHRRAVHAAAEAAGRRSAERYLGLAVFYSGGSMAAPGLAPVPPHPAAAGRYASAALMQAGYRTDAPDTVFARALALGEAVAERGLPALAAAGAA